MLSAKDNELLTQVAKGTPMGELLRRYWWPVAGNAELASKPTKAVRLLGEDLTLYRDRSGGLGLIGAQCPHRHAGLVFGIPEEDGLRCAYHGWKFNARGECVEQPFEQTIHPDGRFREACGIEGYPVEELGGLIWAYLGPAPAPLLPRWDVLVMDGALRQVGHAVVPCNWLQCMENSVDPVHSEWLHGHLANYVREVQGRESTGRIREHMGPHQRIDFELFEYGIVKRRMRAGDTEESEDWKYGHPLVFPNMVRPRDSISGRVQVEFRVPLDYTHTWQLAYEVFRPGTEVPPQEVVPMYELRSIDDDGEYILDYSLAQDMAAWWSQGEVTDRTVERLGESDRGIILLRRLLREQLALVQAGADPMNVFRDPERNRYIALSPQVDPAERERLERERARRGHLAARDAGTGTGGPLLGEIEALLAPVREEAASSAR